MSAASLAGLDVAADQAIAACGGDAREAVKALIVANDFLEQPLDELRTKVSTGYARGRLPRARELKDEADGRSDHYVVLPFVFSDGVAAGEATECFSANAAVMRAEALSRKPGHAGAIAFSRSGDPATGDFGDATLIRKFGDVPENLSALKSDYPPSECSRKKRSISLVASGPCGSV
jgi:hypothetical protein